MRCKGERSALLLVIQFIFYLKIFIFRNQGFLVQLFISGMLPLKTDDLIIDFYNLLPEIQCILLHRKPGGAEKVHRFIELRFPVK